MIVTSFPRAVREIEHTTIPLKDGTRLAARIWLPEDAEADPVPALLEYLPYRKRDGTHERDALTHPYLAGHGYAAVRVDIRGSGESEGVLADEYSQPELDDALEVIDWLASQPWCSGAVGMFGISWGGFNALQVAALQPPALKAIVTLCSTDDRYADDVHYMGGAKLASADLGWGGFFFADMCHPPDPLLVGERWREMWLERLQNMPLFLERWLRHQRRDAYWRHGSVCEEYSAIRCPVFAVGGWTDGYTNSVPRLLEHLDVPRKGLIGPWAHAYPHFAKPGPQIGFLQEMLRWWDHWLKGKPTGVMDEPMLRAWMTASHQPASHHETLPGRWVAEPAWPPRDRKPHRLFLADSGLALPSAPLAPRDVRSPQTLGSEGGEWCPFGRGRDQAGDQRPDDSRSLLFETPPLDQTMEILGAPVVTLDLACDKPVANLVVRLCDVHPSGAIAARELRRAEPHASRQPCRAIAAGAGRALSRAPAAQRLRRDVSGRPPHQARALDRLLADGLARAARRHRDDPRQVRSTCRHGRRVRRMRRCRPCRRRRRRRRSATRSAIKLDTEGKYHLDVKDDDPTSAVAEMRRAETKRRGDWQVRSEVWMRLSCTRDAFRLQASLSARAGDEEVCQREWDCAIPRDLV